MSNVVFILGAGASKECGAPVMAEFLDVARNLLATGVVGDSKEDFERVFETIGALQAVHSKSQLDLTNIESIFTALEIAKIIRKLPNTEPDDIDTVISSLKRLIVKTIELTMDFPINKNGIFGPIAYLNFVNLLFKLKMNALPKQTISVITFNYDIGLDMALCKRSFQYNYGIQIEVNNEQYIPLFKLHGSLNWATRSDSKEIIPLYINEYLKYYNQKSTSINDKCKVPIGSQLEEYFSKEKKIKIEPEPVIVPPTWNKSDQQQALSNVWSNAARHLSEAEQIFILGYSLPETDAFFRILYALGTVGKNPLTRIIVYNPDTTGEVNARFQEMLGPGAKDRYQYRPIKFNDAVFNIEGLFLPQS